MYASTFTSQPHTTLTDATANEVRARLKVILPREWDRLAGRDSLSRQREQAIDTLVVVLRGSLERCHELTVLDMQIERAARCLGRWVMLNRDEVPSVWIRAGRMREDTEQVVRIDPFALAHLLSSGIPSAGATRTLSGLTEAVRRNDVSSIRACFEALGRLGWRLGPLGPVRALFLECARANLLGLPAFAFELAVLEKRLHNELGWENARAFVSLVAALEPRCASALRDYLEQPDLIEAANGYRTLRDKTPVGLLEMLRRDWNREALPQLQKRVRSRAAVPLEVRPTTAGGVRSETSIPGSWSWWARLGLRLFDRSRPGASLGTSPATS
jgi:hypothetical protein